MTKKRAVSLLWTFILMAECASAQGKGAGFPPFGTFANSDFDTIDVGNLNVHLMVPIFSKAGRGLPISYSKNYDNSGWTTIPVNNRRAWVGYPGWLTTGSLTGSVSYTLYQAPPSACSNGNPLVLRRNYVFSDMDGTPHSFGGLQAVQSDCNGQSQSSGTPAAATDNSGYLLSVDSSLAVTITTVGGVLIHPPQNVASNYIGPPYSNNQNPQIPGWMTDTNGNQIKGDGTDTLGTVPLQGTFGSAKYPSPTNPTNYVGATFNYTPVTIQTNFQCYGVAEYGPSSGSLLTSIVLADGSTYSFGYEPTPGFPGSYTGRLTSIQLPSGGTISYTYSGNNNGIICADGSAANLTRTTPDGTWSYNRTVTQTGFGINPGGITSSTTTIIDPQGNQTVVNFGANDEYEVKRQFYWNTGTPSNPTLVLLETDETCYNGGTFPCSPVGPPFTQRTVKKELPDLTGQVSETDTHYNSSGLVTDVYNYDFGSGQVGSLIRHTATTYAPSLAGNIFYTGTTSGPSYQVSITNRPQQVTVYDGSQPPNIVEQTTYGYDETAVDSSSGTPNLVPITGNRGNPTTITSLVQGTTTVSRTNKYFDTGLVHVASDLRNTGASNTTYSYSDSGGCGNAFVTTVSEPMNLTQQKTWDCNGGVLKSTTDENGQSTSFTYGDPNFWRLTETDFPDGGVLQTTYNLGTTLPWNIVKTMLLDATGRTLSQKTTYDTLARTSNEQITSDPEGTDNRDTTYDGNGRVYQLSNWYRSKTENTYGLTTFAYDALNRITQQTQQDGTNSITSSYSANCVTVTDEAGKQRYSCNDGLGRLVQVNEPGPAATKSVGSISVAGSEQSHSQTATSGSTTITVSGSPQSGQVGCPTHCTTIWNSGNVTVTINGTAYSASYGGGTMTAADVASGLATSMNSGSLVTASANGNAITVRALATGSATNYSVSTSCTYGTGFSSCAFSASGSNMTGGQDGGTTYDSGTVSLQLNGQETFTTCYGQGSGTGSLASDLVTRINSGESNGCGSNSASGLVTASLSGSTLTLTAKTAGAISYSVSSSSASNSGGQFSPSFSFTPQSTSVSGGQPGGLGAPSVTLYSYSALGNLLCVEQHGGVSGTGCSSPTSSDATSPWRVRRFSYDGLSRLTQATVPEVGSNGNRYTTFYYYTAADGSLCSGDPDTPCRRFDSGRNITTTYSYDYLNRLGGKTYTDSTPALAICYDGRTTSVTGVTCPAFTGAYGNARRTGTVDGSGSATWSYDNMGRAANVTRVIGGVTESIGYVFNYDGTPASVTYPSGQTVAYTYSGAGRMLAAQDTTNAINYVQNATYTPWGALTGSTLGADHGFGGIALTQAFNNRQQVKSSVGGSLFNVTYGYDQGGGANNGNIASITNSLDSSRTATYTYDQLNRLATAVTPNANNWGNTYGYDSWGNLLQKNQNGNQNFEYLQMLANGQNQLSSSPIAYDAAGNVTTDNFGQAYTYDAENRIATAQGVTYTYDADGNRVSKSTGTLYWTGAGKDALAETDLSGNLQNEYVFLGSTRIARRDASGNRFYYLQDHLGTTRVIADQNGNKCYDGDYYPWGAEEHAYVNTCPQNYKFTGKERDAESGLDNFGARYFGSTMGRFMSPDWSSQPEGVPYAVLDDPQSLNLYSYVRNNPLSRTDPTGHYEVNGSGCAQDNAKCQKRYDKTVNNFEKQRQKGLRSKDPRVRAAAAAFGDRGTKNGVHVGFADLRGQGIKGSVDPMNSGKGKLIDIEVTIDNHLGGGSLRETIAHEGTHVKDDINFLTSYDFNSGHYDPAANFTHGQTEFNAFQAGAGVNREHGFGPNDTQAIQNFLHNSPAYGPIYNVPVFSPNNPNFPQHEDDDQ